MENKARPTTKIKLPIKEFGEDVYAVIFEYATGGDYRLVQNQLVKFSKIKGDGSADFDLSSGSYSDLEDVYIERFIVSIDGENTDILKRIKELRSKNYQYLLAEITKLTTDDEVKKN